MTRRVRQQPPAERRRKTRRWRDNVDLGASILAIALWVFMTARIAEIETHIGTDRRFLQESCARLNILRAEDNVSHYADFLVFRVVLVESQRVAPRPDQTPQERNYQRIFLVQLRAAVKAKTWTPLTNCTRAINQSGIRYRAPQPTPFVKQLPPKQALRAPSS